MNDSDLAANVDAVNRANVAAGTYYRQLAAAFRPLVGQKVTRKADNTLTAKAVAALPELPHQGSLNIFHRPSATTLEFTVKACTTTSGHAFYHDVTIRLAPLKDGVLGELYPPEPPAAPWTVARVIEGQRRVERLEEELREARSALGPFRR